MIFYIIVINWIKYKFHQIVLYKQITVVLNMIILDDLIFYFLVFHPMIQVSILHQTSASIFEILY